MFVRVRRCEKRYRRTNRTKRPLKEVRHETNALRVGRGNVERNKRRRNDFSDDIRRAEATQKTEASLAPFSGSRKMVSAPFLYFANRKWANPAR